MYRSAMGIQSKGIVRERAPSDSGVVIVIVVGAFYVNPANWSPFIPPLIHDATATGGTRYGVDGMLAAASIVFFAVFGYDTLTTAAEESKNPQRDLPLAVLASLGVAMVMYLGISLVLTGMVPYNGCVDPSEVAGQCQQMILASDAPVSAVFAARDLHWVSVIISIATVSGIACVVFVFMLGRHASGSRWRVMACCRAGSPKRIRSTARHTARP